MSKNSFGVILFRENFKTKQLEVLVVQRRFTYAFFDFVLGKYTNIDHARNMFNNMTSTELLEIYSLNFERLWCKIWIDRAHEAYFKAFNRFTCNFMYDGGLILKRYILAAIPTGELLWNCPKGQKEFKSKETDILCAVRELKEETSYEKRQYTILPNVTRKIAYIHDGIRYVSKFYIGFLNQNITVHRFDIMKAKEIEQQKWVTMNELKTLNSKTFLENLVKPAKKLIKKYRKGKFNIEL